MPPHKGDLFRQDPGRLQHRRLDPAHVGDHGPRLEVLPVLGKKVHNPLGVEAEDDQIPLRQSLLGVLLCPVHNVVLQGVAQGGLAYVHPHPDKILKPRQRPGNGAANQPQTYNDCLPHIDLLLS